jgi:hypothetical protein
LVRAGHWSGSAQFWLRDNKPGGSLLRSVESVDEADRVLGTLPLVRDNPLTFDLMSIGPLMPHGISMKAK